MYKTLENTYKMYYEGISKKGVHAIGLALSADGENWQRSGDDPVLYPSDLPGEGSGILDIC